MLKFGKILSGQFSPAACAFPAGTFPAGAFPARAAATTTSSAAAPATATPPRAQPLAGAPSVLMRTPLVVTAVVIAAFAATRVGTSPTVKGLSSVSGPAANFFYADRVPELRTPACHYYNLTTIWEAPVWDQLHPKLPEACDDAAKQQMTKMLNRCSTASARAATAKPSMASSPPSGPPRIGRWRYGCLTLALTPIADGRQP